MMSIDECINEIKRAMGIRRRLAILRMRISAAADGWTHARRDIRAARFHAALHVHRELPAQEQVLGGGTRVGRSATVASLVAKPGRTAPIRRSDPIRLL